MAPRDKRAEKDQTDAPSIAQQDWDAIKGAKILPDSVSDDDDEPSDIEKDGELPEEDDDNAYQNSDEALPDDDEERAIGRDPSREGRRFDEE
ncbi:MULTISPECIES: hypothetical protein [unclassified Mesorhizobium]|nr:MULTISPECIES: hypothetical protein [unclassified Mesorhizobium]